MRFIQSKIQKKRDNQIFLKKNAFYQLIMKRWRAGNKKGMTVRPFLFT